MPAEFTRTIATSGKFVDARILRKLGLQDGFTDEQIRALHRNTLNQMRTASLSPVIKFGHWDEEQRERGSITDLRLKRMKLPSGRTGTALEADFVVNAPFAGDVLAGLLPKVSIETDEIGVSDDGSAIGECLTGLALIGRDQPAIPHLPKALSTDTYRRFQEMATKKSESWATKWRRRLGGKDRTMDIPPEEMEEIMSRILDIKNAVESLKSGFGTEEFDPSDMLEAIDSAAEFLAEKIGKAMDDSAEVDGVDPDTAERDLISDNPDDNPDDDKDDDDMKKNKTVLKLENLVREQGKQLQTLTKTIQGGIDDAKADDAKIEKAERDKAFAQLHKDTKVLTSDRDFFDTAVENHGLVAATDHYRGRAPVNTPPGGSVNGKGDYSEDDDDTRKQLTVKFSGPGFNLKDDRLKQEVDEAMDRRKELKEKMTIQM